MRRRGTRILVSTLVAILMITIMISLVTSGHTTSSSMAREPLSVDGFLQHELFDESFDEESCYRTWAPIGDEPTYNPNSVEIESSSISKSLMVSRMVEYSLTSYHTDFLNSIIEVEFKILGNGYALGIGTL